ncbi:GNAT family N-acetyltransferase [Legionella sp. D16C41]|uniref:GNAT family N-acetyltransferase n=1 Tax=Legionella sp. D16C41 TaxID=3402688 RepID=UPI003AF7A76E
MTLFVAEKTSLVRNATLNDIEQLIELRKLLLSQGTGHYVAQTPEDELAWQNSYDTWLKTNLNQSANIKVIVTYSASDENIITGCAIGIIDARVPFKGCLNGKMGWVQTVVVRPNYRRQGLAEQLMNHLFKWFHNNEVGKVTLQTTSVAKSLYDKLGFIDSGEAFLIKTLS